MPRLEEGQACLCTNGSKMWECKVQRVQRVGGKSQYLVHYQGWHKRFDEWLPEERVLEATEANLAHARAVNARVDEELAAAKQSKRDRERAAAAAERAEAAAPALAPATLSGGKRKANPARETEEDVAPAALTFGGPPAPSVKFSMLPALKKQLVDDWDRITQKKLLVRLPRPAGLHTASSALDAYIVHLHATAAAEGGTGSGSASAASAASEAAQYATPETVAAALHSCSSVTMPFGFKAARDAIEGLRLYFDRALPLYLLYRFERLQLDAWLKHVQGGGGGGVSSARAGSNSAAAAASFAASAVYGPEHLLRLFIKLPDLLAHISLSDEETKVLQITVNDLLKFFAKHSAVFFPKDVTLNYKKASAEYLRLWEGAVGGGGGGAGGGASAKQGTKPWTIADPRKLLDLEC